MSPDKSPVDHKPAGIRVSPYVINDLHDAIDGVTYDVWLETERGRAPIGRSGSQADLPADSVTRLSGLTCYAPKEVLPGGYELLLFLRKGGQVISSNSYAVEVRDQ